jgi:tetratricopeptide (TPR) repeat protein
MTAAIPTVGEVEALVAAARVDRLVARLDHATGIGERRWLRHALATAIGRSDPGAVDAETLQRATAHGVSEATALLEGGPPAHSVVVPFAAGALGIARRVYVGFDLEGVDDGGALAPASRDAVRHALLLAARCETPPHPPERYRFGAWLPGGFEGVSVDGASLGAAALVSAVALWSGRAVLPQTAISASLVGTRLVSVGGHAAKIDALIARADVARLVVASADRAAVAARVASARGTLDVIGVDDVEALLVATLAAPGSAGRGDDDVDHIVYEARRAFAGGWASHRWPVLRERLERVASAIPAGRPDLEVAALTMLGAARRHLGAPEESARILARAAKLAAAHAKAVPDPPLVHLCEHLALTHAMLGELGEARSAARRAVRIATRARLGADRLKALGTLGLVELAADHPEEAAAAQSSALALASAGRPAQIVRSCGYLAEARAAAGDLEGVRDAWSTGCAQLASVPASARDVLEAWLRVNFGSALVRCDVLDEALTALSAPVVTAQIEAGPLPGLLARRALGRALVGRTAATPAEIDRGLSLLGQSPASQGLLAAPRFLAMAHVNVLFEARARLVLGIFDADMETRALRALGALPRYGRVPEQLAPLVGRVRAAIALAVFEPVRLIAALDALLARAVRLGL